MAVQQASARDTDADWRHLGETEPYWGVLTQPAYRRDHLTPQSLEAFYATGRDDIAHVAAELERATGVPLRARRALDFGCGVGRLSEAMTAFAEQVIGYDVAPGMLATARQRGAPRTSYVDALPDAPFDWINSLIVLQHIAPTRGLPLIAQLIERLAPGGALSLQLTVWTDETLHPPAPRPGWLDRVTGKLPPVPAGTVLMHDYDLNAVCRLLNQGGVTRMMLLPTDHGGHHGVIILARRDATG